jgi:hypothetical protein
MRWLMGETRRSDSKATAYRAAVVSGRSSSFNMAMLNSAARSQGESGSSSACISGLRLSTRAVQTRVLGSFHAFGLWPRAGLRAILTDGNSVIISIDPKAAICQN